MAEHALILGMTDSGKTTLATRLANLSRKQNGIDTIVLDSMHSADWNASFQTDDESEFLRVFWASRNCDVFVDEAGDAIGKYDKIMERIATKGRHWGHNVHFITQRGAQISRTIRDQCRHLFLFVSGFEDCKVHARERNCPELVQASDFEIGEYFHKPLHGALTHRHLFRSI